MVDNNHNSSPSTAEHGDEREQRQNSRQDDQPQLISPNRPPAAPRRVNPATNRTAGAVEQQTSTQPGTSNPSNPSNQEIQQTASGQPSAPSTTPAAALPTISPDDAGSVVNATPLPITPGPHRRELGISPVRLTPSSNFNSPSAARGTAGEPSASPANEANESLVLWGTSVNMQDAEERLTSFIKGFRLTSLVPETQPQSGKPSKEDGNTNPSEREGSDVALNEQDEATKPAEISSHYIDLLQQLAETGESVLNVDMSHLQRHDSGLYQKVRAYPNELITVFDAVATSIFKEMFPDEAHAIDENKRKSLQVRTYNLLPNHVQSMRELNPSDISNLVAVRGMIIRASSIIPEIQVAMYSCSKCRAMRDVRISHGRIDEPRKCSSCNTRDSFTLVHSRSTFSDKQMVRLQEAPESIPKGETPATFTLVMYDSLVDTVKPGDRVEITGILRATPVRVNPKLRVVRSVFRTYIDCVHICTLNINRSRSKLDKKPQDGANAMEDTNSVQNRTLAPSEMKSRQQGESDREFFETLSCHPRLYDRLASSLAPSIFGMEDEKKGALLQLFGGSLKKGDKRHTTVSDGVSTDSQHFRSSINILLVGDPGTSKSQLLHSAHRLSPRGVYTSGRGSSAVGLTAYVTRDPDSDDYVLESGALVLSDRGICCIDEFDKMSDFARSVLHEAMEQQTVSVAKAGIIATLNARTAVLAAANPVNSRYDTTKSVVDNIDLPPTLLSRFDLIYLVLDAPNADSDRRLAQHIVSLFFKNYDSLDNDEQLHGQRDKIEDLPHDENGPSNIPDALMDHTPDLLDAKTLTDYIAFARENVNPTISDDAAEALINGYVDMRSKGRGTENISATPRQLESLIRLAEAHAKMHLREQVDASDVKEAVRLVQSALHMAAYDPITGKIDMNLFSAGKSRESNDRSDLLDRMIVEKLKERTGMQETSTTTLLSIVRGSTHIDITAGDFREAVKRLEQADTVVRTSGGTKIRLAKRE